jgi:hypothetical protein
LKLTRLSPPTFTSIARGASNAIELKMVEKILRNSAHNTIAILCRMIQNLHSGDCSTGLAMVPVAHGNSSAKYYDLTAA